jgi:SAM-dependent methyltransferase
MATRRKAGLAADPLEQVHMDIERYYTQKVTEHGPTPLGVDWSCVPTQEMRFVQLLKLCDFGSPFTLNDIGCGYGALLAYLKRRHRGRAVDYVGADLSAAMIDHARRLWSRRPATAFVVGPDAGRVADYAVCSGIFNVRLNQPLAAWEAFVANALEGLRSGSSRGFAANFLAPAAPGAAPIPQLYRVEPDRWVRYCERELGARVEVIEGYGMCEFTLLARMA